MGLLWYPVSCSFSCHCLFFVSICSLCGNVRDPCEWFLRVRVIDGRYAVCHIRNKVEYLPLFARDFRIGHHFDGLVPRGSNLRARSPCEWRADSPSARTSRFSRMGSMFPFVGGHWRKRLEAVSMPTTARCRYADRTTLCIERFCLACSPSSPHARSPPRLLSSPTKYS